MNLASLARFYIGYLLFNIGGWVYFGYLLYYASYITTSNCNSYTKELTDVGKIFVGVSMALTSMNVWVLTNAILKNYDDEDGDVLIADNMCCTFVATLIFLSISSITSLVVFCITSGMTNIECTNSNAEFGLTLSVYGIVWLAFVEMLLIMVAILYFLYNIIVKAKMHLLCAPCLSLCRSYNERRISFELPAVAQAPTTQASAQAPTQSPIPKYNTNHITISIPKPVYTEEPKLLCSVCYDSAITLLLESCNHICMCNVCYELLEKKECPICKTKISTTKIVYFASPGR